jgi:hypothetical protein
MPNSNNVHVYPTKDLIEHDTDSEDCICGPTVEACEREDGSYGWLLTHHSMDGREFAEPDYSGPSMPTEAH